MTQLFLTSLRSASPVRTRCSCASWSVIVCTKRGQLAPRTTATSALLCPSQITQNSVKTQTELYFLTYLLTTAAGFRSVQRVWPNRAPTDSGAKKFFSGSSGYISCITVHHCTLWRALQNSGKQKKGVMARVPAPYLYWSGSPKL